jgi:hypothetical protein
MHIVNQYKTSIDNEIYEFDYIDNANLQETCDVLQPVIFKRNKLLSLPCLDNYRQILNLKDSRDYYKNLDSVESIELPCKSLLELLKTDDVGHYFSENNQSFIEESGIYKNISLLDEELQPKFTAAKNYDILMGSVNTSFPLRYHKNTRKYLYVVNGSVKIKMCSRNFSKYLHLIEDFESLEFVSPINPWTKEQTYQEYVDDLENVQFLEFEIPVGHILYVPNYWFYSVKFTEPDTKIVEYNYSTIMNRIAHIDDLGKYYLQNQNIVNQFTKSIESSVSKEETVQKEIINQPELIEVPLQNESEQRLEISL